MSRDLAVGWRATGVETQKPGTRRRQPGGVHLLYAAHIGSVYRFISEGGGGGASGNTSCTTTAAMQGQQQPPPLIGGLACPVEARRWDNASNQWLLASSQGFQPYAAGHWDITYDSARRKAVAVSAHFMGLPLMIWEWDFVGPCAPVADLSDANTNGLIDLK